MVFCNCDVCFAIVWCSWSNGGVILGIVKDSSMCGLLNVSSFFMADLKREVM